MRRLTLKAKTALAFLLFLIIAYVFFSVIPLNIIRSYYRNEYLPSHFRTHAGLCSPYAQEFFREYSSSKGVSENSGKAIKRYAEKANLRITLILPTGRAIEDSHFAVSSVENQLHAPEVLAAFGGDEQYALQKGYDTSDLFSFVYPIEDGDDVLGVLRLRGDVLFLQKPFRLAGYSLLLGSFVLIIISVTAAFLFSKYIKLPINEVSDALKDVAEGNLDARVLLEPSDEMRHLTDNFNEMVIQVKSLFRLARNQTEEFITIMEALQEGLFVLDSTGLIKTHNSAFSKIIKRKDARFENRYYWDIIREPSLYDVVDKAKNREGYFTTEVTYDERIYLCGVSEIGVSKTRVFVLHDITEMKTFARRKKAFVDNVSHELRTPLTAIKGFAETLSDEVKPSQKKYVEIIERNTNRLIRIVEDLLVLSELEEPQQKIRLEKIELNDILENTLKLFEKKADEKKIKLYFKAESSHLVKADAFKIEQVFINLIDNAIKYTEKGKVSIQIKSDDKHTKVIISDTGIGIPKGDLEQIFERFYVVDKSRSRLAGGTGLGLSIVKHIMLLHGGRVEVESFPERGTEFTLVFPNN